ncbi:MucBP domain-containing protein [Enterococcus sp.]|uniref:MucBP domain-containing protein n=1 Tax=Enterococcus sp. TaxID=35783 RepID=UPI00291178D7|nr:MucBP domain-containing protein [Enterococcus sp.]MDU5336944.1 MucBP domain-containing protein [Enterococcus sp.]
MRKNGFMKYSRLLILLIMTIGVLQIGGQAVFAEESKTEVTTEYTLFDSLSVSEQKSITAGQPNRMLKHDVESFRLVYKKMKKAPADQTAQVKDENISQTASTVKKTFVPRARSQVTVRAMKTLDGEVTSTTQGKHFLPQTGEEKQNKTVIVLGILILATAGGLLIWKRKQGKKILLILVVAGGLGVPSVLADTIGLPGTTTETLTKGSVFKPITSITDYEYVGYIHTVKDDEIPSVPEEKEGTVVVHYLDQEGNKLEADMTLKGKVGEAFTTEEKAIDGYRFKDVQGNAIGTFTEQAQEVTYIYEKNPVKGADITVHYMDENGNKLEADITLTGNVGEIFSTEEKIIDGYSLINILGDETGTFTEQAQEVTYIYRKNPVKGANVNVHFVEETGNIIGQDVVLSGNIGESYEAKPLEFPGMSVVQVIGETSGTFGEQEKDVTFVYRAEREIGRVLIDFNEIISRIGENFYIYTDENNPSTWTSVKAEGFLFFDTGYRIPDEGMIELSGEVGTLVESPINLDLAMTSHPLGLIYRDSEGQQQIARIPGYTAYVRELTPSFYMNQEQKIVYYLGIPN